MNTLFLTTHSYRVQSQTPNKGNFFPLPHPIEAVGLRVGTWAMNTVFVCLCPNHPQNIPEEKNSQLAPRPLQLLRCSDYCLTRGHPCKSRVLTKTLSFHFKVVTHKFAPGFWVFFNKGAQQTLIQTLQLREVLFGCNHSCQFIWTKSLNFHKMSVVVSLVYCLGPHRLYQIGH